MSSTANNSRYILDYANMNGESVWLANNPDI